MRSADQIELQTRRQQGADRDVLGTIQTPAGELVVISRTTYDRLQRDRIRSDERMEDALTKRLLAETDKAAQRMEDAPLPVSVWERLETGANAVATIRSHRGLSQGELSRAAGISQSYLSQIEHGNRTPSVETLISLAHCLHVPLGLLVAAHISA